MTKKLTITHFTMGFYSRELISLIFLLLVHNLALTQTVFFQDGFNGGCTSCSSTYFTATTSGTPDYYGMSTSVNNTGCPNATPYASEGANAFHVRNGNVSLTSQSVNVCPATNLTLSLKLAAYSNIDAEGLDDADFVEVSVSPDGGTTYYPTLRVKGNSNAKWLYGATGTATTAYDGDGTAIIVASPAGSASCALLANGISNVQITNLPTTANLRIRIQMVNNDANERWLLDDFKLTSTAAVFSYCSPAFSSGVEPITNVTFAGISNTTSNATGGSAIEYFCQTGTVTQGATHAISLKGNTNGNYINYYQVYIDWNQNGILDNAGESYTIGTITNSTGIDATVLTGNIAVPAGATLGKTTMRVIKRYNANPGSPCVTGSIYGQAEDYILNVVASAPTATLLNYAANPLLSTSFAHRRGATAMPKFTVSSTATFNAIQIELNHASNFSGTAVVSTISNGTTYNASTSYDFWTTQALTGDRTYFVRVRLSANAGALWGQWTTVLWPYSYYPSTPYVDEGWHYTTLEQFNTGVVQESSYNFYNVNNNSTSLPDDDFMQVNEGTFSINAGAGDGVNEHTWYPSVSYMTLGWQNNCNGNTAIYNGFPFVVNIPQSAVINSADFSVVATTDCVCESQNVAMRLIFDAHNVSTGPTLTGTNTTSTISPARTTANQTFLYNATWTNDTRYTLTSVSNILQEIVNRSDWSVGNNFNLMGRWNTAFSAGSNNNRCIRQADNGSTTAPRIAGTFTNFKNTVNFPSVNRAMYGPNATVWKELKITDNTVGCGTCYTEYRIHDASTNAVLAGPFVRTAGSSGSQAFDISSVTTQSVYVSASMFRNSSPQILDIWLTATTIAPLPIELTSFDGSCKANEVNLAWSTASERNSDFFTIESSLDGTIWEIEGIKKAAGNSSSINKYTFSSHSFDMDNVKYYRLKSTDFDGEYEYFEPISLQCKETNITIYPNPNAGSFVISGAELDDVYKIFDYQGKLVFDGKITSVNTNVQLDGIADGVYVIRISGATEIQNLKVILKK